MAIILEYSGCKENHFYSLPFGQAEAAFTCPDVISTSLTELVSEFLCYSNSSKNITCPSGKLKIEFTSPIESTNPGLSDTTFFARWYFSKNLCCTAAVYYSAHCALRTAHPVINDFMFYAFTPFTFRECMSLSTLVTVLQDVFG